MSAALPNAHPEAVILPDICVMLKILSSEYHKPTATIGNKETTSPYLPCCQGLAVADYSLDACWSEAEIPLAGALKPFGFCIVGANAASAFNY